MTTGHAAAEALKPLAEQAGGADWDVRFGFVSGGMAKGQRYAVIRPQGGAAAELTRRPIVGVVFIGAIDDAVSAVSRVAEEFAQLVAAGAEGLAYAAATEPVITQTADGRPVAEISVSTILSL